jgi:hypothetical protein
LYENIVVVVIVEMTNGNITEADCSLSTDLSRRFVSELISGYNLEQGIGGLLTLFENRFHGSTRRALESALKIIYEKYIEARESLTK